jgi:hypothetical protein
MRGQVGALGFGKRPLHFVQDASKGRQCSGLHQARGAAWVTSPAREQSRIVSKASAIPCGVVSSVVGERDTGGNAPGAGQTGGGQRRSRWPPEARTAASWATAMEEGWRAHRDGAGGGRDGSIQSSGHGLRGGSIYSGFWGGIVHGDTEGGGVTSTGLASGGGGASSELHPLCGGTMSTGKQCPAASHEACVVAAIGPGKQRRRWQPRGWDGSLLGLQGIRPGSL